jgi:hypothetical protein
LVGAGQDLFPPLECHSRIQIPCDQHDPVPSAQHRRLGVLEIVGRIDDVGEPAGALHAPARLAGDQQLIVAHGFLNDDSART